MPLDAYVPDRIGEGYFIDWQAPTSGDDGKPWAYNHSTGNYEPVAAVVPGGSTTQVQYNSSNAFTGDSGFTYNGSGTATLSTALVAPIIKPASDSTTAVRVQNAAGTSDVITVNTTDKHVEFAGAISTNGAVSGSYGMTINQSADSAGLLVKGSDDQASSKFIAAINASGSGFFSTTGNMLFLSSGTQVRFQADNASGDIRFANQSLAVGLIMLQNLNVGLGGVTAASAAADVAASTTSRASLRIRSGTAPTTPNDGDVWKLTDSFVVYATNGTIGSALDTLRLRRDSSNTPIAGFGSAINFQLKSSTTAGQDAGRLSWEWVTATHASRASRGTLTAYSTSTEQEAIAWDGDSSGVKLGLYGATPVAQAAAYTQTYATADRTISSYTADDESSAFTGIDNAQGGSVYAQLSDLNNLRVAYENLRALAEDTTQALNAVIDDLQAIGISG